MGQLNFIYSQGFGTTLGIYDQHRRSSGLNCDRDESSRFFFLTQGMDQKSHFGIAGLLKEDTYCSGATEFTSLKLYHIQTITAI